MGINITAPQHWKIRLTENAGGTEASSAELFDMVEIGTMRFDCPAVGYACEAA
jgi:hypothetical protein